MRRSIFTKEEDMKLLSHMESFPSMTKKMNVNQWIKQFELTGKNHQQIHSRWRGLTSKNSKFTAAKVADSEIKRKISEFKESQVIKGTSREKWEQHTTAKKGDSVNRKGMLKKLGISGEVSKVEMEDYKYEDGRITASKVTFFFKLSLIVVSLGIADYLNFI